MNKILLSTLFFLFLSFTLSAEEQLEASETQISLDLEPSALVNKSVNIISGTYVDTAIDFVLPGAEPIYMQRNYMSSLIEDECYLGHGWLHNHFGCAIGSGQRNSDYRHLYTILDGFGGGCIFGGKKKNEIHLFEQSYIDGITNCSHGHISARTNICNFKCKYKCEGMRIFTRPSGEKLLFSYSGGRKGHKKQYDLQKEKKTNGNFFQYNYLAKGILRSVAAYNKNQDFLDGFTIERTDNNKAEVKHRGRLKASYNFKELSCRRKGDYAYKNKLFLTSIVLENGNTIHYDYNSNFKTAVLRSKRYPDGRYQNIKYYNRGKNSVGDQIVESGKYFDSFRKVRLQEAPVGTDSTPIITHRYFYRSNLATVYNALNHCMKYEWDEHKRLCGVYRYTGTDNHTLHSKEFLYWGNTESENVTRLIGRGCKDHNGQILFLRHFTYDKAGNVTCDKLYGNLSGEGPVPFEEDCECFYKKFTYRQKKFNLITSMTEGSLTESYEYQSGTDLLTAKFYSTADQIVKREFYTYDENAVLIREIEDDGNSKESDDLFGVTQRHIRHTQPRTEYPIGLPEIVKETYVDLNTGQECLFKKTVYHYSDEGRLVAQDLYDSNETWLCTLNWEYDLSGNIIKETNSDGQIISRFFDANGNMIYEQGANRDVHKEFTYDFSNRLIHVDEIWTDGTVLSESYKYNYLSQKIASIDIYGNETQYEYDEFSHLIKTIRPAVPNKYGVYGVTESTKEYNLFNAATLCIDFNGNTTHFETNIRGKPTRVHYPDGSIETTLYNLDGTVRKITHVNGSTTEFCYDHFKRLISKETKSKTGKVLEFLQYAYNAFHLLSESDTAGNIKTYRYDFCGRLIETIQGDNRVTYLYDTIGRLCKTIEHDGNGGLISHVQVFDHLDRVIEERQEDADGKWTTKVCYGYDASGNKTTIINYTDKGKTISTTTYNPRGQPIKIVDAEKNTTHILYKYDYLNEFGQFVPYVETTDPMGNITINICDAQGRLTEVIQKNSMGVVLHKKEFYYDSNGNKCRQVDHVMTQPGSKSHKITTIWTYDCMNRLTGTYEAFRTSDQKYTEIRYNAYGEKETVVKADGVRLQHAYDALGRLKKYYSSEDTINYIYHYDMNSNLVAVIDAVNNLQANLFYDNSNRLIKEVLPNGLTIEYTYDGANRTKILTFPDRSGVEYVYNANQLVEIHRLSNRNKKTYCHKYLRFDLDDNLMESQLIGNAGKAQFEYDRLGRNTELNYETWKEFNIKYDSSGNIIGREVEEVQKIPYHYSYDDLYQVTEEKENNEVVHTYACDSLYNRIAKDENKHLLNDRHQLLDDSETFFTYDPNGNITKRANAQCNVYYKYDALDRLIKVISKNNKTLYTYDSQNRRLTKQTFSKYHHKDDWKPGPIINYLYAGQNEIGSYDQDGNPLELRLLGLSKGSEIGSAVAIEIGKNVYAPIHDHLGNVTALIDASTGKAVEYYRYTAFGKESLYDGAGNSLAQSINPWRFSSKRVDDETGFIYFGRRYYDPLVGRWITPDPIGPNGGPNSYAYVLNSPLVHFDAYGLMYERRYEGTSYTLRVLDTAAYGIIRAVNFIGTAIECISSNFVPIPVARDVLRCAGILLSGKNFDKDFHFTFCGKPIIGSVGTDTIAGHALSLLGGIMNNFKSIRESAEEISKENNGQRVDYYCASSDGLILDILKAGYRNVIGELPEDKQLASHILNIHDRMVQDNGGEEGIIHMSCHSQGGRLLENARGKIPDICKAMDVQSYGSAHLLNPKHFYNATNYVSTYDLVPVVASPFAYTKALITRREDVIFIKSKSLPIYDHEFRGKTYMKALNEVSRKLKSNIYA